MEDQFDEDLRSHIRKVFEQYDEPSAAEGWSLLRKKFPGREKRRPIAWIWWSAAALLLLFIGIGLWRYEGSYRPEITRVNPKKSSKHENLMAATGNAATNPKIRGTVNPPAIVRETVKTSVDSKNKKPKDLITAIKGKQLGNQVSLSPEKSLPVPAPGQNEIANGYAAKTADSIKSIPALPGAAGDTPFATVNSNARPAPSRANKADTPKRSIYSMFAATPPKKEKSPDRKPLIRLGVYAATYVSYASGSSNQGNLGAGFTADLRITKNLKLVSGVGVLHNSLIFNNSVPTTVAQNVVLPTYSYAGYLAPATPSAFNVKDAANVASLPAFKNYDASMYGLDIPVNLRYDFNPQKNNLYIMAGLSSGTYINESYTYKYNYPDLSSPSLQQTQDETSRRSFDSFYFGKVVNFAVGFAYPLGRNNLILEPFLKYPLDGLGSQNIRFGSGGINLKFNFPTTYK